MITTTRHGKVLASNACAVAMAPGRRIFSVFIMILSAVFLLLSGFFPAAGQQLPVSEPAKGTAGQSVARIGLPNTPEETDREIGRLDAALKALDARAEQEAGRPEALAATVGAAPGEFAELGRMTSELRLLLDKHIKALKDLKVIRKESADHEAERASWKGFAEKPPYAIAFIDDIRDDLLAQRLAVEALTVRLSLAQAAVARYTANLKKSRAEYRLIEEGQGKGAKSGMTHRNQWLVEFVQRKNELNEAGVVASETQRLTCELAISARRAHIAFIEQKLDIAETSSPLTRKDLDQKLAELDDRRRSLEAELRKELASGDVALRKLDAIRAALAKAQTDKAAAEKEPGKQRRNLKELLGVGARQDQVSGHEKRISALMLELEAQRLFAETSQLKAEVIKGQLTMVNTAERTWETRYRLTLEPDLKRMKENLVELAEMKKNAQLVRHFAETSLASWMNLVKNQKDRLALPGKTDAERRLELLILNTYEERQAVGLKLLESIGRSERLIDRQSDEMARRIAHASSAARMKERLQAMRVFWERIWNTELYVAEETMIVQEKAIARPVSVTIGKVVKALFILIAGVWLAGWLSRYVQRSMTKRLGRDESKSQQFGKLMFIVMFAGVLVFSLLWVNIPLAVFAFLGGALAIGIGFGAQHLINNFISGLILLFDRSIKEGDIVEVDGQGGRVTSVGMRNSRIQRFDGIELLVPNSKFLQEKVTNWTLTDRKVRYMISVGVAYGSPTRETARLLSEAVTEHPSVLTDPPATVLFSAFAESVLTFEVYFWLELHSARDNRIVLSELRHAINETLAQSGIVIAFPQKDVHIDSARPLEVRVVRSGAEDDNRQEDPPR